MAKILVALGMGGHTSQILRLVDKIKDKHELCYLICSDDQTSKAKIRKPGPIYYMKNPRDMKDKNLFTVFFKMFPATRDVNKVLKQARPNVVLCSGPSMAIPLFWIAKLRGIKTIFLESWVRVHHKSQAGKFVYPITDLFIVQWKTMLHQYKKAKFRGRLS
jgi:beta-1,4-N-acetylglucosaminyltransferase